MNPGHRLSLFFVVAPDGRALEPKEDEEHHIGKGADTIVLMREVRPSVQHHCFHLNLGQSWEFSPNVLAAVNSSHVPKLSLPLSIEASHRFLTPFSSCRYLHVICDVCEVVLFITCLCSVNFVPNPIFEDCYLQIVDEIWISLGFSESSLKPEFCIVFLSNGKFGDELKLL